MTTKNALPIPAYVASLAPRGAADARRLLALVPPRANAVEYRMDLAEDAPPPETLVALDPRPAILTWRSLAEGGNFSGSAEEYRRRVSAAYDAGAIVDVEHARGLLDDRTFLSERDRVLVSLHSPFSVPPDAGERIAAMGATGARAAKLVAGAPDLAASLEVAGLQRRHADGRTTVFPMGPASPPGRILSALFGGALVYGPVERDTAAGQLPIGEMLDVFEVDRPRVPEALFGVVAGSIARSLSPRLHNALFRARGLPWLYLPLPVADFERERPHELDSDPPFRGFAVTQPWKLAAARAGRPSEDVRAIGAANTLVREGGRWRAENTDVDGVFDTLADHDTGEGRTAVIVGAGGAARAAAVASRRLGYEVAICARRDAEADRVAGALGVDSLSWEDLPASGADLYVNATPIGWRDDEPSILPPAVLENRPLVFDCVYRRDGRETSTIRAARQKKCPTVDGLQMFAVQAVRQAQLFGVEGVTGDEVLAILREGLSE
ncbi:MAG: type I 3-dehydroquinate dehydratase [Syntrophomonadaceae bacterium]